MPNRPVGREGDAEAISGRRRRLRAEQEAALAARRFRRRGVDVKLVGLNAASASLMERLCVHDKPGGLDVAPGH